MYIVYMRKIKYKKKNFHIYSASYNNISAIKKYYKGNYYIFLKSDLGINIKKDVMNKLMTSKSNSIIIKTHII